MNQHSKYELETFEMQISHSGAQRLLRFAWFVSCDPSNVSPSDELAMAECQCCVNGAPRLNSTENGNSTHQLILRLLSINNSSSRSRSLAETDNARVPFIGSCEPRSREWALAKDRRSRIHFNPSFMNIYVRLLFLQLRSSTRLASCACRKDNEAFTYACNRGTSLLTQTFNYESAFQNGARARQLILVSRNVRRAD